MDDRVPEPWHRLHREEYETAVAEGIGAMWGTCMGMGEDAPFMTTALHKGLRYMAASCFDRGYQTNRDEDHDCTATATTRAEGWAAAVKALRNGADVLALTGRPVQAKDYRAAADYLEALAESPEG